MIIRNCENFKTNKKLGIWQLLLSKNMKHRLESIIDPMLFRNFYAQFDQHKGGK